MRPLCRIIRDDDAYVSRDSESFQLDTERLNYYVPVIAKIRHKRKCSGRRYEISIIQKLAYLHQRFQNMRITSGDLSLHMKHKKR